MTYSTLLRSADARQFELPGIRFTGLASPSRGTDQLCTWMLDLEPGLRSSEHHTIDRDEVFLVLSGTIRLHPDSPTMHPGDAAIVPAGQPIAISNAGDGPAIVHVAISADFTAASADGTPIETPPWAR
jgi:quercetin dioxygenase-like cupin family protein